MPRTVPSLLCVLILSLFAASAFSQNALELLDHAQKDLQTRAEAKRNKKPADEDTENRRTNDQYLLQNVADQLRQAREVAASGDLDSAARTLAQLQSGNLLPADVATSIGNVVERLRAERTAKEADFTKEVDAACQRAAEVVTKAKDTKDLDATLADLTRVAELAAGNRFSEYGRNRAVTKLQAATTFVNRWQDYLLARSRNNDSNVGSILRNLAENSNNQPPLIPRSEILALQPLTDPDGNDSSNRSRRPRRPQTQIDASAIEIVQGTKTFEDIPAALTKLVELRREITGQPSYSYNSNSELGIALSTLQGLQKTYLEFQNGLATSLSIGPSGRSEYDSHPDIENAVLPLRVQLVRRVAARLLGATENEKAGDTESLDAYLRRLIEAAKKRQDWDAVVRGLELKHTLAASTSTTYTTTSDQEVAAFKSFFAGRNLEQAGQYEQAVVSYLTALRSGQEDLPNGLIGEHLAAIQKEHAAEYTAGTAYVLNPPPSSYGPFGNLPRPGPIGFPRGMYDPRGQGFPGTAGTPADEKVTVPAASPLPTPVARPVASPTASPSPAP